ncbi:hypothetical protein T12_10200 [Trichinella patagoniensis]|uniref:Uncharacterized protein n=1 Tax=Trichinella patagoniensis TaxID=990121 RepID=A0A0V0ZHU1_9BILA|nr:hypothetical protein T12_10200 [Trichinella patagoniensis]
MMCCFRNSLTRSYTTFRNVLFMTSNALNSTLQYHRSLKFACAYLNTQASSPSGTPLKRQQDG